MANERERIIEKEKEREKSEFAVSSINVYHLIFAAS
jgi:hypothetical protein